MAGRAGSGCAVSDSRHSARLKGRAVAASQQCAVENKAATACGDDSHTGAFRTGKEGSRKAGRRQALVRLVLLAPMAIQGPAGPFAIGGSSNGTPADRAAGKIRWRASSTFRSWWCGPRLAGGLAGDPWGLIADGPVAAPAFWPTEKDRSPSRICPRQPASRASMAPLEQSRFPRERAGLLSSLVEGPNGLVELGRGIGTRVEGRETGIGLLGYEKTDLRYPSLPFLGYPNKPTAAVDD